MHSKTTFQFLREFTTEILISVLFICNSLAAEMSLRALNRAELTMERNTRRETFRDRLDVDFFYEKYRIGARFEMDEEIRIDTLLGERLSQRFAEYKDKKFYARFGNFYGTFGKGLTFRSFADENVYLDRDVDGIKFWGKLGDKVEGTGLAGKIRSDISHLRTDLLAGGEINFLLSDKISFGGCYLRQDASNLPRDVSLGMPVEELASGNISASWGGIDFYGEYGERYTWGKYDPIYGWIGTENINGKAGYISLNYSREGFGIALDAKNYRNFNFPYNGPPTVNRLFRFVNSGLDERGWQGEVTFSPYLWLTLIGNFSDAWSTDKAQGLKNGYIEWRMEKLKKWRAIFYSDYKELRRVEPAIALKEESAIGFEGTQYIGLRNSIFLSSEVRKVKSDYLSGIYIRYIESKEIISFSHSTLVSFSLIFRASDKRIPEYNDERLWIIGESVWNIQNHQLKLRYGKERGGLECSSGICRYEPPFFGLRASLLSRF